MDDVIGRHRARLERIRPGATAPHPRVFDWGPVTRHPGTTGGSLLFEATKPVASSATTRAPGEARGPENAHFSQHKSVGAITALVCGMPIPAPCDNGKTRAIGRRKAYGTH